MLRKNLGVAWMFTGIMDEIRLRSSIAATLNITLLKPFAPFDAVLPWLFVANPAIVQEQRRRWRRGRGLAEGERGRQRSLHHQALGDRQRLRVRALPRLLVHTENGFQPVRQLCLADHPRVLDQAHRDGIRRGPVRRPLHARGHRGAARPTSRFFGNDIPSLTPFAIKLNNQVGPTRDINVRKALSHAFDYEAALEAVSGRGEVMQGPLATRSTPWHKGDLPVLKSRHGGRQGRPGRRASTPTASRWSTSTSPDSQSKSCSA